MPRHFKRHGNGIRAMLQPVEIELLRSTRDQLREVLTGGDQDDPVVRRFFPTAVLGDQRADEELRALVSGELLEGRLAGLDALVELLDRGVPHRGGVVRLDLVDDEPFLMLGVLNDLRIAIGASIDIEALDRDTVPDDDPLAYRLAVMDHLGWLQEQLLSIIDPASVTHGEALGEDRP
jgi:hypothetical protein